MIKTFKAKVQKLPQGKFQVESSVRNHKVIFDESLEAGGDNKGINPIEGLISALGACISVISTFYSNQLNFKYESFEAEIEADLDPDGFKGVKGIKPGLQAIRTKLTYKTNESPKKAREFAELVEKMCPVGSTLTNSVKVELVDVKTK